jgi:hypothetical protein
MPGKQAPWRRKVTVWLDGRVLDRYRELAPPRSLAGLLTRALAAEVGRLERERLERGREGGR